MTGRLHRVAVAVYARLSERTRLRLLRLVVPTYTVGAICVVRRDGGELLLVRQSYRPDWTFVGGSLDRHEAPADAGRREAVEEIGVAIELTGPPAVVTYPDRRDLHLVYPARLVDEASVPRAVPPEILEVGWFAPDALPVLHREARRALETLRAAGAAV